MLNPFERMQELIKGKGELPANALRLLEMRVVLELCDEASFSEDAKLFIRKFLGMNKQEFQVLCSTESQIRQVIGLKAA